LLGLEEGQVKVYAADTLKEVRALTPPPALPALPRLDAKEPVRDAGPFLSPDGRYAAAPTPDQALAAWDVGTGGLLWRVALPTEGRFRGGAFTADGRGLAVDMEDFVLLLERTTGKERRRLRKTGAADARGRFPTSSVSASFPDQQRLAAGP